MPLQLKALFTRFNYACEVHQITKKEVILILDGEA